MIKVNRISLSGEIVYGESKIYEAHEVPKEVPQMFENQLVWRCRDGLMFSDINDVMVIYYSKRTTVPSHVEGFKTKLVSGWGMSYDSPFVVTNSCSLSCYPTLLGDRQIVMVCNEGTLISTLDKFVMFKLR